MYPRKQYDVVKEVTLNDEDKNKLLEFRKEMSQAHIKYSKAQLQAVRIQEEIRTLGKKRDGLIQKIRSVNNIPDDTRWDVKMGNIIFFR